VNDTATDMMLAPGPLLARAQASRKNTLTTELKDSNKTEGLQERQREQQEVHKGDPGMERKNV